MRQGPWQVGPSRLRADPGLTFRTRAVRRLDESGRYLSFNLNINLPPPLPRAHAADADVRRRSGQPCECGRVPQDSPFNVPGVHNIPCETVPGIRAPSVKMCESDNPYVAGLTAATTSDRIWRRPLLGTRRGSRWLMPPA